MGRSAASFAAETEGNLLTEKLDFAVDPAQHNPYGPAIL